MTLINAVQELDGLRILNGSDFKGTNIAADVESNVIQPPTGFTRMQFVYYFNEDGTHTLAAVPILRVRGDKGKDWVPVNNAVFPVNITSGKGADEVTFESVAGLEYSILIDFSSGAGSCEIFVNFNR